MNVKGSDPTKLTTMVDDLHSSWQAVGHRRKRLIYLSISGVFLFFLYLSSFHTPSSFVPTFTAGRHALPKFAHSSEPYNQIANGTLGFGAIFALGLQDRFDKQDAMELAASVTGLQLTWVDGVSGAIMNPKAAPPRWKMDGTLGCWRGHMNIMRRIVKENIASALIMEDDADWDVHIVEQMQQFSDGTKELLANGPRSKDPPIYSPYGEGWDILWIGHLGGWPGRSLELPSVILKNDSTVPPAIDIEDMLTSPHTWNGTCAAHLGRDPKGKVCDSPRLQPDERILKEASRPLCTYAYAVSLQGAKKYLAKLGGIALDDVHAPVDREMGEMCTGGKDLATETTRCFSISPPYIRSHRAKGLLAADSDIRPPGEEGKRREVGMTNGVVWSARLNALNLITGSEIEAQYKQDNGVWRLKTAQEYANYGRNHKPPP